MYEATTTIQNQGGLHARGAAALVQAASQFRSTNIKISCKGKTVDAKSILMLMSMGLRNGHEIRISAEGPDEEKAVKTLTDMVNNNFGRN